MGVSMRKTPLQSSELIDQDYRQTIACETANFNGVTKRLIMKTVILGGCSQQSNVHFLVYNGESMEYSSPYIDRAVKVYNEV